MAIITVVAITYLAIWLKTIVHECGHVDAAWFTHILLKRSRKHKTSYLLSNFNNTQTEFHAFCALCCHNGHTYSEIYSYLAKNKEDEEVLCLIRVNALGGLFAEILLTALVGVSTWCLMRNVYVVLAATVVNLVLIGLFVDWEKKPQSNSDFAITLHPEKFEYRKTHKPIDRGWCVYPGSKHIRTNSRIIYVLYNSLKAAMITTSIKTTSA